MKIFQISTGLTGLVVAKNPHHLLASLYGKTLRALAQMPETAAYRVNTEKIIRDRAHIVATVWTFNQNLYTSQMLTRAENSNI